MKPIKLFGILILSICTFCCVCCDKNDRTELIDPSYKILEVSCGYDFEIPVLARNWNIEYVQEIPSGENILDKKNNPLFLDGKGKVEASNGWLALTRDKEDSFIINLKENFDKSNERKFTICINEAGNRDYITVIQKAGEEYKLVKSEYKELEEKREIYQSNKGCSTLVLNNNSSEAVWEPYEYIFMDVVYSSQFESDDYGAFNWIPKEGIVLSMPELIIDNTIRWDYVCTYKNGITTTPYIKDIPNGSKILMQPYSTTYLRGEITYCKRICNYTFTIQNTTTGSKFDINGIWTQIVPVSSNAISSDK